MHIKLNVLHQEKLFSLFSEVAFPKFELLILNTDFACCIINPSLLMTGEKMGNEKLTLNPVVQSYEKYDEDLRLSADNVRRLEFMTALEYMNKYLKPGDNVLDVAAGTGAYALYYAARGVQMTALDITPSYIDILRQKATDQNIHLTTSVNDARDLSNFSDQSFDHVFCMGPLYHLPDAEDREKVMSECMRVLKSGGLLFLVYINKFFVFSHLSSENNQFLQEKWFQKIIKEGVMRSSDEDCFWTDTWFTTPSEIEALAKEHHLEKVHHIAQDGIGRILADHVNAMNTEYFKRWTEFHIRTCEEPSILGISNHGLLIGKKIS